MLFAFIATVGRVAAATFTVTESAILPPVPVQVMVYVFEVVRLPVDSVPLVALVPVKPFEATHDVALVDVQVRDAAVPLVILKGPLLLFALMSTVGAEAAATFTVTESEILPPAPVQVRVYVFETVSAPLDSEPLIGLVPVKPLDAVQDVALVDVQERVAAVPLVTFNGPWLLFALISTVGEGEFTVTVTELEVV